MSAGAHDAVASFPYNKTMNASFRSKIVKCSVEKSAVPILRHVL